MGFFYFILFVSGSTSIVIILNLDVTILARLLSDDYYLPCFITLLVFFFFFSKHLNIVRLLRSSAPYSCSYSKSRAPTTRTLSTVRAVYGCATTYLTYSAVSSLRLHLIGPQRSREIMYFVPVQTGESNTNIFSKNQ